MDQGAGTTKEFPLKKNLSMVDGTGSGYLPARRAAKIDPMRGCVRDPRQMLWPYGRPHAWDTNEVASHQGWGKGLYAAL